MQPYLRTCVPNEKPLIHPPYLPPRPPSHAMLSVRGVVPIVTVNSKSASGLNVTVRFQANPQAPPSPPADVPVQSLTCASGSGATAVVSQGARVGLLNIVGTGYGGNVTLSLCPVATVSATATAYFYDAYPTSVLDLGQPYSYGSMASFTTSTLNCCKVMGQATVQVQGALAIQITNNAANFLHLAEIQVGGCDGAPDGRCWGGACTLCSRLVVVVVVHL
jgi:hypothetical protein